MNGISDKLKSMLYIKEVDKFFQLSRIFYTKTTKPPNYLIIVDAYIYLPLNNKLYILLNIISTFNKISNHWESILRLRYLIQCMLLYFQGKKYLS